jgi:hypothetical protein
MSSTALDVPVDSMTAEQTEEEVPAKKRKLCDSPALQQSTVQYVFKEPTEAGEDSVPQNVPENSCGPTERTTLRRTVSFSTQCVTRITESPEPSEGNIHRPTDMCHALKAEDGPKASSQLLDDLVISFFERGTINGPDDLRSLLVASPSFQSEIPCVTQRYTRCSELDATKCGIIA